MKKKKILFICPYPENVAPSQRLKFEQYYDGFRSAGYELSIKSFISPPFWEIIYKKGFFFRKITFSIIGYWQRLVTLFTLRRYNIVYVHLWVTPFGPPLFERLVRALSRALIYDIDDLVYLKNIDSKAHPLVTLIKGRKKPIYLMKCADHVITCTPYLDNFVKRFNSHTTDISSTVDTDTRYNPPITYEEKSTLTLGWSGSLSTSKYFYLLKNALVSLSEKYDFEILVIGDSSVKIDGLNIEAINWKEETEIANLRRIDIGLYPLPDEEWVLGKSGLKAIQYMALGIPTVATAIGANYRVIENNVSGFLVKTEGEWIEKLSHLIEDRKLREFIGKNARMKVERNFSIKENLPTYLKVLNRFYS